MKLKKIILGMSLSGYGERGVNKTLEFTQEFPSINMFGLIWDTGV